MVTAESTRDSPFLTHSLLYAMRNISILSLLHSKLPLMPTQFYVQFPRLSPPYFDLVTVSCTLPTMLSVHSVLLLFYCVFVVCRDVQ
jgi:hypothetical protein